MDSVIAFIPARGGSKGIKDKNLQKVGPYTLVEWAVRAALASKIIRRIIVSSDSDAILDEAKRSEVDSGQGETSRVILHRRSKNLSQDNSKVMETVKEVYDFYNKCYGEISTMLMLQPTSPLRKPGEVDHFLQFSFRNRKYQPAVSIRRVEDSHPARMYVMQENNSLYHCNFLRNEEFFPRQKLSKLYLRDGGFYLFTKDMIENSIPVVEPSLGFVREFPFNVNIDSPSDLELANIEFKKMTNVF